MADIKQAIDYAKQNPNTPFANELRKRIEGGQMNNELNAAGLNNFIPNKSYDSFSDDSIGDAKQLGTDLKNTTTQTFGKIKEAVSGGLRGEQGMKTTAYQVGGSVAGGIASGIGNLFKGVVKVALPQEKEDSLKAGINSVATTAAPVVQGVTENPFVQSLMSRYESLDDESKRNIDATLGFGSLASEFIGGGVGAKVIKPVAIGAKNVAGKVVENVGTEAVGKLISKGGEKIYKSAFNLTADEAGLVQNNIIKQKALQKELVKVGKKSEEGKILKSQIELLKESKPIVASDTALRKGILGTEKKIGSDAGAENTYLWKNQVEPALKSSSDRLTKEELFSKAKSRVESEVEPGRKQALQDAFDALQDDYKDFVDTDLVTANQIKTSLDRFTPSKIFKGQDVASEYKTLKADLAGSIREKTYSSLKDSNIKGLYRDYANLKQLEKIGIKALSEAGVKGGFGSFWTTIYDHVAIPVKTIGGQVLYRVGNKLQFIGRKGIKTVGEYIEEAKKPVRKP